MAALFGNSSQSVFNSITFFSAIKNKLKLEHKFFSLFQENVRGEIIENLH